MNKRLTYLLVILAVLLLLILPMLLIPSPWVQRNRLQLPYPATEIFYSISDLSTWPAWAWPWSEEPEIRIIWYDNTAGAMSGFFYESKRQKLGDGVVELRETNIPQSLFCVKIDKDRLQEPFSFSISPVNDSVSILEKRVEYRTGSLPWERLSFWLGAASKKKKTQKELQALSAYLEICHTEKKKTLE
jgi:hypothetical protein